MADCRVNLDDTVITLEERDRFIQKYVTDNGGRQIRQLDPQENSDLENRDDHPLTKFRGMENLKFSEISITVNPEALDLRISAREIKRIVIPFSLLGLTKRNNFSLNKQGEYFMSCARREKPPLSHSVVSRLSRSLRDAFDTTDTPFAQGAPTFRLYIPKDEEAERRAQFNPSSYNDERASQFLRDVDPQHNPNSSASLRNASLRFASLRDFPFRSTPGNGTFSETKRSRAFRSIEPKLKLPFLMLIV